MVSLSLSDEQARELAEVLGSAVSDLRMEIVDTEKKEWRDAMKERRRLLEDVIERLQPQV